MVTLEILDFSDAFFREKGEAPPPHRSGKFVVMKDSQGRAEYLVLSPQGHCLYHTDIVDRFCQLERFQIDGVRLPKSGGFVIHDPGWSVVCGGRWELIEEKKRLRIYGSSQAYPTCHLVSLKKSVAQLPAMESWEIDTE